MKRYLFFLLLCANAFPIKNGVITTDHKYVVNLMAKTVDKQFSCSATIVKDNLLSLSPHCLFNLGPHKLNRGAPDYFRYAYRSDLKERGEDVLEYKIKKQFYIRLNGKEYYLKRVFFPARFTHVQWFSELMKIDIALH